MVEAPETLHAPELADLGRQLHNLRAQRGWTLEELARAASLSKSYLSRLEEGERQPSLAALLALSRAFSVPLTALFEAEQRGQRQGVVVRAKEATVRQGNGLTYQSLSGNAMPTNMQPVRVIVPAEREGKELYRHEGEEWLYVLSGTLTLTLSEDTFTLHPGDAAHFDAREPHRLTALGGLDAELLLVACPAPRQLLDSYL